MLYAPYDERPHAGLAATAPESIPQGDESTIYVLTHADIIPPEQFVPCKSRPDSSGPCGNELLINLATASRTHAGNMRFDVLTQSNRTNHMTVVEMWSSAAAQSAHQTRSDKKHFRFEVNLMTGSLWDERLYRLISH
jgi:quinol monooxygenase YgiN